jgi:hypothetical protein
MNRDRLVLRTAELVIGLTLFANTAEGEHNISGPVADDRPSTAAHWTHLFGLSDNATYYGGCGYPGYATAPDAGGEGYLIGEPRIELNYHGCERSCLFVPQSNQPDHDRTARAPSSDDRRGPEGVVIGSSVVIDKSHVPMTDAVVESRIVLYSLETGYDAAYDEAMCGPGNEIHDSAADISSLLIQWPAENLPDLNLSGVERISRAAKELRIVKAWQRAFHIALRPNGETAEVPNRQLLLRAADALDGVGSAMFDVAANLRGWASDPWLGSR